MVIEAQLKNRTMSTQKLNDTATHKLVVTKDGRFAIGKIVSDRQTQDIYGGRKVIFHRTEKTGDLNEMVATQFDVTEFGQYNSLRFSEVEILKL
jgi:hypothetical protein